MQTAVFRHFPLMMKVLFTVLSPLPLAAAPTAELLRDSQELPAPDAPVSAPQHKNTEPATRSVVVSAAVAPAPAGLTFTVLADSALGTGVLEGLAAEAARLAPAPVTVVFRGLPVDAQGNFRRDESERRLAPLLTGQVPTLSVVIDPVRRDTLDARAGTAVTAPSVLLGTPAGDVLCKGTAGLLRALHEARSAVRVPAWQAALTDGLNALPFDAAAEDLLP